MVCFCAHGSVVERTRELGEGSRSNSKEVKMMILKDLQDLYAYNAWANEQVIQSITGLSSEIFEQDLKSSHGSIRGTVTHIVSAEWIWLQRWKGISPRHMLSEDEFVTSETAIARWKKIDTDLADFIRQLKQPDLERIFSY